MSSTVEQVAALVQAGARGVLQRVQPGLEASRFAVELSMAAGVDFCVQQGAEPDQAHSNVVVDLRGWTDGDFEDWDADRALRFPTTGCRVFLLDMAASKAMHRAAPQLVSWLGGVTLPVERTVRPAQSDEELQQGRRMLDRLLAEGEGLRQALAGQVVCLDLSSGRLFVGTPGATALDRAREGLDQGIVFLDRLE